MFNEHLLGVWVNENIIADCKFVVKQVISGGLRAYHIQSGKVWTQRIGRETHFSCVKIMPSRPPFQREASLIHPQELQNGEWMRVWMCPPQGEACL